MSKPCSSNHGNGCTRGFTREKCNSCDMGSIPCDMCNTVCSTDNGRLPMPRTILEKEVTRERPMRTASISYQLPLPSGRSKKSPRNSRYPSSPSIDTSFNPNISENRLTVSAPSSPTTGVRPMSPLATVEECAPRACIFCINGRKACSECFGLGYAQRICRECHRSQHRRKGSLPTSLNQFGTKIKEQFFNPSFTSLAESSLSLPFRNSSESDLPSSPDDVKGKKVPRPFYSQLRSKSMVSIPSSLTVNASISTPILRPLAEVNEGEGSTSKNINIGHGEIDNKTAYTVDVTVNENIDTKKKKSLKTMVMSAIKLPELFQNNKNTNNNGRNHRRQWSLRSISMVHLPTSSSAA